LGGFVFIGNMWNGRFFFSVGSFVFCDKCEVKNFVCLIDVRNYMSDKGCYFVLSFCSLYVNIKRFLSKLSGEHFFTDRKSSRFNALPVRFLRKEN